MPFARDILLIDFESTGPDPLKDDPIQLGAVLLDKETLEEKKSFCSLIKGDLSKADDYARSLYTITQEQLDTAPDTNTVINTFVEAFGFDVLLSSWVENLDRRLLVKMLANAGIETKNYDYHFLDLWPLAYAYLLSRGYAGSMKSEEMFRALDVKPRTTHDALNDCRIEADILRMIMTNLRPKE